MLPQVVTPRGGNGSSVPGHIVECVDSVVVPLCPCRNAVQGSRIESSGGGNRCQLGREVSIDDRLIDPDANFFRSSPSFLIPDNQGSRTQGLLVTEREIADSQWETL
jgi:hypothetical protein